VLSAGCRFGCALWGVWVYCVGCVACFGVGKGGLIGSELLGMEEKYSIGLTCQKHLLNPCVRVIAFVAGC
jgi:hypothetical protein